jgi:hypothetical protein
MAYYLAFDGADDKVTCPQVSFANGATITIKLTATWSSEDDTKIVSLFGTGGNYSAILIGPQSDGRIRIYARDSSYDSIALFSPYGLDDGLPHDIIATINTDTGLSSFKVDGVEDSVVSTAMTNFSAAPADFGIGYAVGRTTTKNANCDLYSLEVFVDSARVRFYNPASTSSGLTLPEEESAQDGTLVNFPTDDSQWVFYAPPAVTPVNPSITNLLATSARLTWEQG